MKTYSVHFDDGHQAWWIGVVVRDKQGRALFVQQVGNYYQRKGYAERVARTHNLIDEEGK